MFQAFIIPFEIGFSFDPQDVAKVTYDGISIFYIIVDIYFIRCFYYRRKKALEYTKRVIIQLQDSTTESAIQQKLLASTWCGYGKASLMCMEIISFLPLDVFSIYFGNAVYFLRLLKLFRLGLIQKYSDKIVRYLGQRNYQFKSNAVRLFRDVFVTIYTSHFFGCIFMFVAHIQCGLPLGK